MERISVPYVKHMNGDGINISCKQILNAADIAVEFGPD
jgi:hypothetical protein